MLVQLAATLGSLLGPDFLLFTVFWVVASAFWIWMLVDCLTKGRLSDHDKLVWALVLLFTHVLGAVSYFFLVRTRKSLPPKT